MPHLTKEHHNAGVEGGGGILRIAAFLLDLLPVTRELVSRGSAHTGRQ